MLNCPPETHHLFPHFFALSEGYGSSDNLRKCLSNENEHVRLATILAISQFERDDLLPDLKLLASQHDTPQLEACLHALGSLHDDSAIDLLSSYTAHSSENVSLTALMSLASLDKKEALEEISQRALQGNLFAISLLSDFPEQEKTLERLLFDHDSQVQLNAALGLLFQKNSKGLPIIMSTLTDAPSLLLLPWHSPGKTVFALKAFYHNPKQRNHPYAQQVSKHIKEKVLTAALQLPEKDFLVIVKAIVEAHQKELIPQALSLLGSLKTDSAIEALKEFQRMPGAPLVRAWSNLLLYQLKEPGPWKESLIGWMRRDIMISSMGRNSERNIIDVFVSFLMKYLRNKRPKKRLRLQMYFL